MNYKEVYTSIFNNHSHYNTFYSNDSYSYDFVIRNLDTKPVNWLDISSGRGNMIKKVLDYDSNILITSTDLAKYHNFDVNFYSMNLSNKEDRDMIKDKFDIVTCLDVLEHLDESYIEEVIEMLSKLGKKIYLTIANHSDIFDGVELHTIQQPKHYWDNLLKKYFITLIEEVYFNNRLFLYKLESNV